MVITDTKALANVMHVSTPEEIEKLLVDYGNKRAESAINNAWRKFRGMLRGVNGRKQKRYNDFILSKDEDNGYISEIGFNKFWHKIANEIERINLTATQEVKDALVQIEDAFTNSLGDIRLDRRISYNKED